MAAVLPAEFYHKQIYELPFHHTAIRHGERTFVAKKLDKQIRLGKWDNFEVCELPAPRCRCCKDPYCMFYSRNGGLLAI